VAGLHLPEIVGEESESAAQEGHRDEQEGLLAAPHAYEAEEETGDCGDAARQTVHTVHEIERVRDATIQSTVRTVSAACHTAARKDIVWIPLTGRTERRCDLTEELHACREAPHVVEHPAMKMMLPAMSTALTGGERKPFARSVSVKDAKMPLLQEVESDGHGPSLCREIVDPCAPREPPDGRHGEVRDDESGKEHKEPEIAARTERILERELPEGDHPAPMREYRRSSVLFIFMPSPPRGRL